MAAANTNNIPTSRACKLRRRILKRTAATIRRKIPANKKENWFANWSMTLLLIILIVEEKGQNVKTFFDKNPIIL